jgi:hypothetical protein
MYATLMLLEHLGELVLAECSIPNRIAKPLTRLRHLSLWGPCIGTKGEFSPKELLHIVSPDSLTDLTIDGTPAAKILLVSLSGDTLDQLVNLTVQLSDLVFDLLLRFLEQCPQLARFEISPNSALTIHLPKRLPSTAILRLQAFKGLHTVAQMFVFGRPVSDVEFSGRIQMQLMGVLSQSVISRSQASIPLRRLSLEIPVTAATEISAISAEHFPDLREFSLIMFAAQPPHLSPAQTYNINPDTEIAPDCTVDNRSHSFRQFGVGSGDIRRASIQAHPFSTGSAQVQ